jgi:septal ring factor EnvC (AmiA/AmiB activator)
MSGIFYWLIDQLIKFLANLNPERAKKVKKIKAEAKRLDKLAVENEAARKLSEIAYRESSERRAEWDQLATKMIRQEQESKDRALASQQRVREIEAQAEKDKTEIDSRGDSDVLRDRL